MRTNVEILDELEIKTIVYNETINNSYIAENLFETFLSIRYGITLEQFDKVIKTTVPEDMV